MIEKLFQGKRVIVMGLGLNGGGLLSAQFCLACGAEVLVTDLNSEDKLADSLATLRDFAGSTLPSWGITDALIRLHFSLGSHKIEDFKRADFVIKNPGVSKHSPYLQAAPSWTTDLALFLELYPQIPLLGITGTKGKSSIAYALHYILQQYFPKAMLGGNIGCSPLFYALIDLQKKLQTELPKKQIIELQKSSIGSDEVDLSGYSPLILELSSWQLADLRNVEKQQGRILFQPQQACLSNILRDHQNSYARFSDYVADKFYIFENISKLEIGDLLLGTPAQTTYLSNQFWSDFAARAFTSNLASSNRIHYFSSENAALPRGLRQGLYWFTDGNAYIRQYFHNKNSYSLSIEKMESKDDLLFINHQDFALLGQNNFQNYSIASYMAYCFLKQRELTDLISFCHSNGRFMHKFRGLPFRMELRARSKINEGELYFINDTTSTMPDATAAGLKACLARGYCLLILGGTDKNLDPSTLLKTLKQYQGRYTLFLLQGNGTDILIKQLNKAGLSYIGSHGFATLREAFHAAYIQATAQITQYSQQYLLFSPGYASFGMFQNEFDRGRQFNTLIKEYLN